MSTVRTLKPKQVICKPKPLRMGSRLKCAQTRMDDLTSLKKAISGISGYVPTAGTLRVGTEEPVPVDFKLNENMGFRRKGPIFEFISTGQETSRERETIKKIGIHFNIYKAMRILEDNGYRVEAKISENEAILNGILGGEQDETIELRSDLTGALGLDPDKETEPQMIIHSKNFADSDQCHRAVDLVVEAIEGDRGDYEDTYEFSGALPPRKKRREEKGQIHRAVARRQERKYQNKSS